MALSAYQEKILEAFKQVCEVNEKNEGIWGASPSEVALQMHKNGTLSDLDTVIDIADLMKEMSGTGCFSKPTGN